MNRYSTTIHFDEESGEFIATSKEFPYASGIGETKVEALEILEEGIDDGVEMLSEESDSVIPAPISMPEYSGNIRLRVPRSLHKSLSEMAELEGISLNQYMVMLLSKYNEREKLPLIFGDVTINDHRSETHVTFDVSADDEQKDASRMKKFLAV